MELAASNDTREQRQQFDLGHEPDHSPISRCTLDVLRRIFEAVILTGGDEFDISTIISHVCRRWRLVALDMPKLWNDIYFRYTAQVDKIQSYLDRMIPRVKATPVDISIYNVDMDEYDTLDWDKVDSGNMAHNDPLGLRLFRLDRIPVINCIALSLCGKDSMARHLMHPGHAFCGCQIDGLEISFPIERPDYKTWSCTELLGYFPSVLSLSLQSARSMYIDYIKPTTQLRFLEIEDVEVQFLPIFWSFPRLEKLGFKLVSFPDETDDHPPTAMMHLKVLNMMDTSYSLEMLDGWLRLVSFPVLSSLHIKNTMTDAWLPFISSHKSINFLEACNLSTINELTKVAPQLQTLVIDPQAEDPIPITLLGDDIHAFSRLENLVCHDIIPEVVSLEKFEEFVRACCLPSHHPDSQRPNVLMPLEALTLIVYGGNPEDRVWMISELYQQAKKDVEVNIGWTHIELSWI